MNRNYKNLVFTKHALERLAKRSISQHAIWQVVSLPDNTYKKDKKSVKFIRTLNDRKYHVVANYLKEDQQWLVISVWVRGEEDKPPLVWQIITLPFKVLGWVGKMVWGAVRKNNK